MPYDELLGTVLLLTGLVTQSRLTPRSDRAGTADGGAAFAAAVGMVVGVHDGAADGGTDAHVTLAAGLTDVDVAVVFVADLADDGAAFHLDQAIFAGGQTNLRISAFLCHQLSLLTCCADELSAAADVQFDAGDDGTPGDVGDGQAVAGLDVCCGAGFHHVASLQAGLRDDISLGAIFVLDQCDVGAAVGIVFQTQDGCLTFLITLEVDDTVDLLAAAASVANGDTTIVVAAALLVQNLGEAALGLSLFINALELGHRHVAACGGRGLVFTNSHAALPPYTICSKSSMVLESAVSLTIAFFQSARLPGRAIPIRFFLPS